MFFVASVVNLLIYPITLTTYEVFHGNWRYANGLLTLLCLPALVFLPLGVRGPAVYDP